jgi:hypothetical protein
MEMSMRRRTSRYDGSEARVMGLREKLVQFPSRSEEWQSGCKYLYYKQGKQKFLMF